MDYAVQLTSQLPQLLKSLRKSRKLTQNDLAQKLGVVQSRIADIERNPGAVSVEQLLQMLTMLGAQMLIRDAADASATTPGIELSAHAKAISTATATPTTGPKPGMPAPGTQRDASPDDEPRGQW